MSETRLKLQNKSVHFLHLASSFFESPIPPMACTGVGWGVMFWRPKPENELLASPSENRCILGKLIFSSEPHPLGGSALCSPFPFSV